MCIYIYTSVHTSQTNNLHVFYEKPPPPLIKDSGADQRIVPPWKRMPSSRFLIILIGD